MVVKNYNSCMNVTAINNTNMDGFMPIAKKITELFPVDVADFASNTTLVDQDLDAMADTLAYLSQNGVPIFGEFWTGSDPQVPVRTSMSILDHSTNPIRESLCLYLDSTITTFQTTRCQQRPVCWIYSQYQNSN